MTTPKLYQPIGGMCSACTKRLDNCSNLNFEGMKVVERLPNGVAVVLCNNFQRAVKKPDSSSP